MAKELLSKWKEGLEKKLHEKNKVTDVLAKIEEKTGIKRLYFVLGVAALLALYMIFGTFAGLVCNVSSFIYPAYKSILAIESHHKEDDTRWLTYWVVYATLSCCEFASDAIMGWFPIYWLVKSLLMLYLYSPVTMGTQKLYDRFIRPFVLKHQGTIDKHLDAAIGKADEATSAIKAGIDQHVKLN